MDSLYKWARYFGIGIASVFGLGVTWATLSGTWAATLKNVDANTMFIKTQPERDRIQDNYAHETREEMMKNHVETMKWLMRIHNNTKDQ